MHKTLLPILAVVALLAAAAALPAQDPAAPAAPAKAPQANANAQNYVKTMVGFMSSPDPRLRYSVREALVVMGPQGISAVNGAKATEKNPNVKAFMTRTVAFIKNRQSRQRGGQMQRGGRDRQRTIDIDRIAMDANLTWEQMDKVLPILKKGQADMRSLMTEFREAGGNFRDQEAMKDLREEMSTIAKEAEPKLKEFLNETQEIGRASCRERV